MLVAQDHENVDKGIAHVKVVARSGVVQCHEHGDALTF